VTLAYSKSIDSLIDFEDDSPCKSPVKIYDVAEPLSDVTDSFSELAEPLSDISDINRTQLYLQQSQDMVLKEPEQRVEILELYDLFLDSLWDRQQQKSNMKVFNIELLDDLVQEDENNDSVDKLSMQANPNEDNDENNSQVFK
jgi:hypothetical protein